MTDFGNKKALEALADLASQQMPSAVKFQIVETGSLKFIADQEGNILSDGFHEFQMYTAECDDAGEYQLLIGRLGSQSCILNFNQDGSRIEAQTDNYHSIEYNADLKAFIVCAGSSRWILDPATGKPAHEKGYHLIERRGIEYYGQRGALEEEIFFQKSIGNVRRL